MIFKGAKNHIVFVTDSSFPEKPQVRSMNIQSANSLALAVSPCFNLSAMHNACMTKKTVPIKAYKPGTPPQRVGQLFGKSHQSLFDWILWFFRVVSLDLRPHYYCKGSHTFPILQIISLGIPLQSNATPNHPDTWKVENEADALLQH